MFFSLPLQVVNPGRESLGAHDHAARARQIRLVLELDLERSLLARVEQSGRLRSQREISVVKHCCEFDLFVERVLEINAHRLGTRRALDGSLRLRCAGLSEQQTSVLHAFRRGQFQIRSAVSDGVRFVPDVQRD
jgi:hypothetical protein